MKSFSFGVFSSRFNGTNINFSILTFDSHFAIKGTNESCCILVQIFITFSLSLSHSFNDFWRNSKCKISKEMKTVLRKCFSIQKYSLFSDTFSLFFSLYLVNIYIFYHRVSSLLWRGNNGNENNLQSQLENKHQCCEAINLTYTDICFKYPKVFCFFPFFISFQKIEKFFNKKKICKICMKSFF